MAVVMLQHEGVWLRGEVLRGEVVARSLDEVMPALRAAERAADEGLTAVGFLCYEAAGGLDEALVAHAPSRLPLAWLGLFERLTACEGPAHGRAELGRMEPSVSEREYADAIARIRDLISAGDTYQVNYTVRLRGGLSGEPEALANRLCEAQRCRYGAYIEVGEHAICCASPELFFSLDGQRLLSRPMKGTLKRGLWAEDDLARAAALRSSAKDRAENAMIVDMVRNDMGRIARAGSVQVSDVFAVEKYPTVYQMTSTVQCRTSAGVADIFGAMFPCASITGAPKVRTMQIIRELEPEPRGVYTGAIGFVAPGRRAQFNVAIRTAVVHRPSGRVEYGVGGGVVWDSRAEGEYAECLAKAAILSVQRPSFELLETMRYEPEREYLLLEEHLSRLAASAEYFDFAMDIDRIRAALPEPSSASRVRLTVDAAGEFRIETAPLPPDLARPWRLKLASAPIDPADVFLYHKTTHRAVYDRAFAERGDCDDVILWNNRGEVTETTIANLVVRLDEELFTPPLHCGLLPGVFRQWLLRTGQVRERVIRVEELSKSAEILAVNSLRGWMRAVVVA